MMSKRLSVVVVSTVLALAGCGGSGGEPNDAPVAVSPFAGLQGASDEPATPTIAADGTALPSAVDARLRSVFDIVNGDAIEMSVAVARRLIDIEVGPRQGFTFSRSGIDAATGIEDTTLLCPEGGTLDTASSRLLSSDGVYILRACGVGPLVLDGRIHGRVRGPDRETDGEIAFEPSYEFDSFSVFDARNGRTIATDVLKVKPYEGSSDVAGSDVPRRFGYGSIEAYHPQASVGLGAIVDQRAERSYTVLDTAKTIPRDVATPGYPLGGMATRFEVSFGNEGVPVEVRTTAPFQRLDPAGHFASGTLTVVAATYAYTLDAADGDPATFRLDVTENDVTTSYTVPWSDAIGFDAFEPEGVDVGF